MRRSLFFIPVFFLFLSSLFGQKDSAKARLATSSLFKDSSSVVLKKDSAKKIIVDTSKAALKPKHDPRIATFRSAVLPGWGQIYNREYWKLPIVYGALAIPAVSYVVNNNYYKWTKFAYVAVFNASNPDANGKYDSTMYFQINPKVKYKDGTPLSISDYQSYRNIYKRDKDYSLLWFIILWGVNVADATVFGHLKDFDVSDNLTMHINPTYTPTTKTALLGVSFNFKNPAPKPLPSF